MALDRHSDVAGTFYPAGARALEAENMDAWESERAIELLIPECYRPGAEIDWGEFYDSMGSGEVPALLDQLAALRLPAFRQALEAHRQYGSPAC